MPSRYPFSLPAIRGLERLTLNPEVTFVIGEVAAMDLVEESHAHS